MNGQKCKDYRLQELHALPLTTRDIYVDRVESGAGSTLKCRVLDKWIIYEVENSVVKTHSGKLLPVRNPTSESLLHVQCRGNKRSEPS